MSTPVREPRRKELAEKNRKRKRERDTGLMR